MVRFWSEPYRMSNMAGILHTTKTITARYRECTTCKYYPCGIYHYTHSWNHIVISPSVIIRCNTQSPLLQHLHLKGNITSLLTISLKVTGEICISNNMFYCVRLQRSMMMSPNRNIPRYWPFVRDSPVTGEFPVQRPVTRGFGVFWSAPE